MPLMKALKKRWDKSWMAGTSRCFVRACRCVSIRIFSCSWTEASRACTAQATVIYPSTQAADGIKLARLLVQNKAMSDLVEVEVPRTVQLYAPVVTADNVDQFIDLAFES